MTTAELDQAVLDMYGQSSSNTSIDNASTRYRILSRAYREVCRKTWLTYRPNGTWTIASGDESFALATKLSLASGYDVLGVVRAMYIVSGMTQRDLTKSDLGEILMRRGQLSNPGIYPSIWAYYRSGAAKTATLDVYPPVQNDGSGILVIDWLEQLPDLTASVDPLTPTYADDAITLLAAAYFGQAINDDRRKEYLVLGRDELRIVRGQSHKESSGYATFKNKN